MEIRCKPSIELATGCHCYSWQVTEDAQFICVIHKCCHTTEMGLEVLNNIVHFDERKKNPTNILKTSLCKISVKADV